MVRLGLKALCTDAVKRIKRHVVATSEYEVHDFPDSVKIAFKAGRSSFRS